MNDDARLAQMLGRLGGDPTPEFRAALRERLVDEATGRTIVPIDVESPDAHRRAGRPGWLVIGAVAAAMALVVAGLVVVTRRDDPSPADQPDVFAALTAVAHVRLLEVRVTRSEIVADPGRDLVASLRIETADAATGVVELSGDDTCNRYGGTITVDDRGRVTGTELESIGEACDDNSVVPTAGDVLRPIDGGVEIVTGDEVHRFVGFEALDQYDPTASGWDGSYTAAGAEWSGLLEIAPGPVIAFGLCVTAVELGDDGFLSVREGVTCSTGGVYGVLLDALLGGSLRLARYGGVLYADTTTLTVLLRPADEFLPPTPDDTAGEPAVEAFIDAVGGRTFVLLPDGGDVAIDRPYITFQDASDPELAVEGFGGCMSFFGRGTWSDAGDGYVSLDGGISVGTAGCSPGDDLVTVSNTTRFGVSGEVLDVVGDETTWSLVAIDGLPVPNLEQLGGRWSVGDEGNLIVDPSQSRLLLGGCQTTIATRPGSAYLGTDGWKGTDCAGTELSLMRALEMSETQQAINQVHLAGDVLVIDSHSAKRRPIVFALHAAGPLLDPTTVSIELGSAFGYQPADEITADEIEAHVSSLLGPTTYDTGWFVTPNDPTITDHEDCMGDNTTRVLWWHDLSFVVWRHFDGTERLFAWSVGDVRATRHGDRREPYVAPATDRSDITTDGSLPIGVGTIAGDVTDAYPDVIQAAGPTFDDGATTWQVGRVTLVVLNDMIVGVGNEIHFC